MVQEEVLYPVVEVLYPVVQEVILGDVLGVNGTPDHHLAPHSSSVDDLNEVHEVLLALEAAHELGVIRRPIIHLHVLSVEEEDGGGDVADVKVAGVDRDHVHFYGVYGRHVAQVMRRFRQRLVEVKTGGVFVSPEPQHQHLLGDFFDRPVDLLLAPQLGEKQTHGT